MSENPIEDLELKLKRIDHVSDLFIASGLAKEGDSRPSYVDFARTAEKRGAKWKTFGKTASRLEWGEAGKSPRFTVFELSLIQGEGMWARIVGISYPEGETEVTGEGMRVDRGVEVQSVKAARDRAIVSGRTKDGKETKFVVNADGSFEIEAEGEAKITF